MAEYIPFNRGGTRDERTGAERTVPGDGTRERPVGSVVSEFLDQAKRLVRAEINLAKAELRGELKKAQSGATLVGVGGVLLLLGGIAFLALAIIVLDLFLALWLSALIVTALFLIAGGVVASSGLKRMKQVHPPEKTLQTLKEDSQWASKTLSSMKSQMHGNA